MEWHNYFGILIWFRNIISINRFWSSIYGAFPLLMPDTIQIQFYHYQTIIPAVTTANG